MTQINNLPFNQNVKFIVIDEDIYANYAQFLLLGWLQEYKQKDVKVSLLLFSTSKSIYQRYFHQLNINNVEIEDFYTITIQENQNNISEKIDKMSIEKFQSSVVIIDCLSSLALAVDISKASKFVAKMSKNVRQLICINRSEFGFQNIPSIETLGDVYVKLKEYSDGSLKNDVKYSVDYVCKKVNGTVNKQFEFVTQSLENCIIVVSKKEAAVEKKSTAKDAGSSVGNIEATFRLDMNKREIEQKKNVDLPYTNTSNSTSKIIYSPDDMDDLDDEDPDDDLHI